jgi:hypothetical protein
MIEIIQTILGSSIITTALTAPIIYFFHKRTERTNAKIKHEFERLTNIKTADFDWQRKTTELLGQVYLHLNRTRFATTAYFKMTVYNAFFEDEVIYNSNLKVRNMLLENGHYLPPELLEDAAELLAHYDLWLAKYNAVRKEAKDFTTVHIFVGPDGSPFPSKAEGKFKKKYEDMFVAMRKV